VEKGEKFMKSRFATFLVTLFLLFAWVATSSATVEWDVLGTLNLQEKPRDAAMSLNGKYIFVLTDKGEILIYSSDGNLEGTISVGKGVEGIKAGPRDDVLLVTNAQEKTVQIVILDFIQQINLSESPVRGNPEAPVSIVTFTDFE
jgi:hypothetical protein